MLVGVVVAAVIIRLVTHHLNIRGWVQYAIVLVIFSMGYALIRHMWARRGAARGKS